MKKLRFFSLIIFVSLIVAALTGCKKDELETNTSNNGNSSSGGGNAVTEYVDLGLPSGTKWKDKNEVGSDDNFYTYEEAVNAFGGKLPTVAQLSELCNSCEWIWNNSGSYKVVGPNGNFISMPAAGYFEDGTVYHVGSIGSYWSTTPDGPYFAYMLYFDSMGSKYTYNDQRTTGRSVRLVTK